MLRPLSLMLAALVTASACTPAFARPLVELDVVDRDTGQWLTEYRHRGDTWVAGVPGNRYAVRLTNTTGERVLVVVSVDGVNVVTGETAAPHQAGYVLGPWQSTEITGWRKSYSDVAQFHFTDLPDSYAARTGRPDNVGVIGIAVFRERAPVYDEPPEIAQERSGWRNRAPEAAAPAGKAAAADGYASEANAQGLGTGHGGREWSPVSRTEFERASRRPDQIARIRYDDEQRLVAMGILPRWQPYSYRNGPDAFPGGFVADPPRRW